MTDRSVPAKTRLADYSRIKPLPDPPKVPDFWRSDIIMTCYSMLKMRYSRQGEVLVAGGGYVCQNEDELGDLAPGIMFAEGIGDPERIIHRNGYVISEVGKPPDLVLEVGSPFGGRVLDYTVKREGYAALRVPEYWRFDPTGGQHYDAPLAGDTLMDGKYKPIEIVSESETRHWGYSQVLGLEFWWDNQKFCLRDPMDGKFLLTPVEVSRAAAAMDRATRQSAEQRARAAESRAAQLEAELHRLRRQ